MYIHSSNEIDKRINVSKIANNISTMVFILVVYHLCCLKNKFIGLFITSLGTLSRPVGRRTSDDVLAVDGPTWWPAVRP